MLCAWSPSGGPCQGDAGDPLVYDTELIGMMSWSFGCGELFPSVFTDVTKLREWITESITPKVKGPE
jgi:secreted trypsin-like serine protease